MVKCKDIWDQIFFSSRISCRNKCILDVFFPILHIAEFDLLSVFVIVLWFGEVGF